MTRVVSLTLILGIIGTTFSTQSQPTSIALFPWHVGVANFQNDDISFCGGTIIAEEWILTSARCIHGTDSLLVFHGTTDFEGPNVGVSLGKDQMVHENFSTETFEHNIGLIRLNSALVFDDIVQAAKLFEGEVPISQELFISTWGLNGDGRYNTLYYLTSSVSSIEECHTVIKNKAEMICAKFEVPLDEFKLGQTGSPVVLKKSGHLVGIFDPGTEIKDNRSGITNVGYYRAWIKSKTGVESLI